MMGKEGNCNIVHYGSNKCKRIARYVLTIEVHALVLGLHHSYVVKDLVEEMIGRPLKLEALVDGKKIFDVISKHPPPNGAYKYMYWH